MHTRPVLWIILVTFFLGGLLVAVIPEAEAHNTANERRTPAQCAELTNRNKRAACQACVRRPRPHHYHPRMPAPRCRPNNAKRR